MKARTIISIMVTSALLAACSSNDSTPVDNKPTAVNFRGGIDTRVSGTKWDGGELIGISALSENNGTTKYTNEEYTSDNTGIFSFQSGSEIFYEDANPVDFTAYYPFAGSTGTTAGVVSKTIAAADESTTGTPTPQSQIDYLWATTPKVAKGKPVAFDFAHEMSELTLKFISGTGAPAVTNLGYTLSGIILNGNFDTSTGTATCGSTTGSLAMSGVNSQSTLILFPDASTQTASLTVTVGNNSYNATGITIPAMAAGKNYELDITLNDTGISASESTITDWASSGSTTPVTVTM